MMSKVIDFGINRKLVKLQVKGNADRKAWRTYRPTREAYLQFKFDP